MKAALRERVQVRHVHQSCLPPDHLHIEELEARLRELEPFIGPEAAPVPPARGLRIAIPTEDDGLGVGPPCLVCGDPTGLGSDGEVLVELAWSSSANRWSLANMVRIPGSPWLARMIDLSHASSPEN